MRTVRWLLTVLVVFWAIATALSVLWVRPWAPLEVALADPDAAPRGWKTLTGAIHVHTLASDGGGTVHEVVREAAAAELDFVVLCDHNTLRTAAEEGERLGVLVLSGIECSLGSDGHALFLGSSGLRDEEVGHGGRRFYDALSPSRVPFVAHPTNKRHPWAADVWPAGGGMELMSFNSSWRIRSPIELAAAVLAIPFERRAAFASIIREPVDELELLATFDSPPPLIASVDAHSRLDLIGDSMLRFPRYQDLFRVLSTRVYVPLPWPSSASARIDLARQSLESGRSDAVVPAFGAVPPLAFVAETVEGRLEVAGARLPADVVTKLSIELAASGVGTDLSLIHNGKVHAHLGPDSTPRIVVLEPDPGIWRVEVRQVRDEKNSGERTLHPWIFSNAIHLTELKIPH
ncbi:MAG: hypothetical protein CME06_17195 [Gemmatimonadetes bacterium]|nr:hypothetical protein [Gemmatimonadota bacterium]